MSEEYTDLWQFGEFRLDARRKVLRHRDQTVAMPLKELEVLSMLVRQQGELVTKDELLAEIWTDSYVEESNLSRHIYLLRKTLKDCGAEGLIENIPRRGYRFAGEAVRVEPDEVVLERHTRTRTLIEFRDEPEHSSRQLGSGNRRVFTYASSALVLITVSVLATYLYLSTASTPPAIKSLAVLPFKSIAPDESHRGAAIADILVTRLASLKNLKIRPAYASAGLESLSPTDAGRKMGVDAVLVGSVYRVDGQVRISARLIDVNDASILWSGDFERAADDELTLHTEIAQQIVPIVAINLSSDEREAIAKRYTASADAYQLYLRGRYEWNKRSSPGMIEAQRWFRGAIAADPNFALAYVGLADTLLTNQQHRDESRLTIEKALELDPNLAEAHASRGFYLMFYDWDWAGSEMALRRSLELNPNYPTAHHWYATLLSIKGDIKGAQVEMVKAIEINPASHNFLADLGQLYYFSGDYEQAESYCRKALELYPDFRLAHEYLHYIYLKTGQYEQAVLEIAKADEINARDPQSKAPSGLSLTREQETFRRLGIHGYFEHRYPGTAVEPASYYLYAIRHALSGENEKALDYLEKSADARMFLVVFTKANPVFEGLRSDRRYHNILRKMGLA